MVMEMQNLRSMLSQPNVPPSAVGHANCLAEIHPALFKALVEKPMFTCTRCGKNSMFFEELKAHLAWDHMRWLPYKCLHCCALTPTKFSMKLHMNESHPNVQAKVEYTMNDQYFRTLLSDLECAWDLTLKQWGFLNPQPSFSHHQNSNVVSNQDQLQANNYSSPVVRPMVPPLPQQAKAQIWQQVPVSSFSGGLTPPLPYSSPQARPQLWQAPSLTVANNSWTNFHQTPAVGPGRLHMAPVSDLPAPIGRPGNSASLRQPLSQPYSQFGSIIPHWSNQVSLGARNSVDFGSQNQAFSQNGSLSSSVFSSTASASFSFAYPSTLQTHEHNPTATNKVASKVQQNERASGGFPSTSFYQTRSSCPTDVPPFSNLNHPLWSSTMDPAAYFSLPSCSFPSRSSSTASGSESTSISTGDHFPGITVPPVSEPHTVSSQSKPGLVFSGQNVTGTVHEKQQAPPDPQAHSELLLHINTEMSDIDGVEHTTNDTGIFNIMSDYLGNLSPVSSVSETVSDTNEDWDNSLEVQDASVGAKTVETDKISSGRAQDKPSHCMTPGPSEVSSVDIHTNVKLVTNFSNVLPIDLTKCDNHCGLEAEAPEDQLLDSSMDNCSEKVKLQNESILSSFGCRNVSVVIEKLSDSTIRSLLGCKIKVEEDGEEFSPLFDGYEGGFQVTSTMDRAVTESAHGSVRMCSGRRKVKRRGRKKKCVPPCFFASCT